jgi:hypothetical protein
MVQEAGFVVHQRRTPLGHSRRASVGATDLHGGGRDGAVCCNGEGLARCFWPWQLVGKVQCRGSCSVLADPSELRWGIKLHQAKALHGPADADNVDTPMCLLPC